MPTCNDLATKAELQELRDQLNAVLGETEEGGMIPLFVAGVLPSAIVGNAITGTSFNKTKVRAAQAITDVLIQKTTSDPIWQELQKGTAQFVKVKGNAVVEPLSSLNQVGKVVGQNTAATVAASQSAVAVSNSLALLSSLVSVAATLGISIATVKVLDKRIEAEARANQSSLDALNQGALKLHEKQQGDIDAVIADIAETEAKIAQTEQNLTAMQLQLQEAAGGSVDLTTRLSSIENDANNVKNQVSEVKSQIAEFESEVEDLAANLQADIAQTEIAIDKALEAVETQKINNQLLENQLELIDQQVLDLQARQTLDRFQATKLKAEFEDLRLDLEEELEVADARTTALEANLIIMRERAKKLNSGGGVPSGLTDGAVDTQNNLLKLASKLTGSDAPPDELTRDDLFNDYENKFQNTFNQLLDSIDLGNFGEGGMDSQQLDDFRANLNLDFDALLTTTIAATIIPQLNNLTIANQSQQVSNAVEQGICQSLNNPTACPTTPANPNPVNGLQGMNNNLLNALGIADLAQGMNITKIVADTNAAVRHVDYGLEKAQNFASSAWNTLKLDKALAVMNFMMTTHNALMLSRNLGATFGEVATSLLNLIGVKNPVDGSAIDVNEVIGTAIKDKIIELVGQETYTNVTSAFNKANRILTAAQGVIWAIRGMKDAALEASEVIGSWVAKIGNNMVIQGLLEDRSFKWMDERPQFKNYYGRFLNKVDNTEEALESVENLVSAGTEAVEAFTEAGGTTKELITAIDAFDEDKEKTETDAKIASASPAIANADLNKKEDEE